jgi:hypothetical protein
VVFPATTDRGSTYRLRIGLVREVDGKDGSGPGRILFAKEWK